MHVKIVGLPTSLRTRQVFLETLRVHVAQSLVEDFDVTEAVVIEASDTQPNTPGFVEVSVSTDNRVDTATVVDLVGMFARIECADQSIDPPTSFLQVSP